MAYLLARRFSRCHPEESLSDELVNAGQYDTDLGYPVTGNAARSIHQGAELAAAWRVPARTVHGTLSADATLSDNHFVHYTEHWGATAADDVSYDGKALGFFPAVMAHGGAHLAWRALSAGADERWTGRIYVDNTQTAAFSIPPHAVLDLDLGATRRVGSGQVEASLRLLNATDTRYATGGWVDYDPTTPGNWVPWLTPAATRNWLATVRMSW